MDHGSVHWGVSGPASPVARDLTDRRAVPCPVVSLQTVVSTPVLSTKEGNNVYMSCMPNTICSARGCSYVGFNHLQILQPSPDVSTWNHDTLQLAGQQWWPAHYSPDPHFKDRSSPWCRIQQDDCSAAYFSLLIAVLHAFPDIPSYASSFHTDCAGDSLQPISIGKSQTLHTLSLQTAIRSAYLRLLIPLMCLFTILLPWKVQLYRIHHFWQLGH